MIIGAHTVLYSTNAEADRAFLRDVLELQHVDAGGGWLMFALPPAEVALHPTTGAPSSQLYLMTDDIEAELGRLRAAGVTVSDEVSDEGWGVLGWLELPSGARLELYEPRHPTAI